MKARALDPGSTETVNLVDDSNTESQAPTLEDYRSQIVRAAREQGERGSRIADLDGFEEGIELIAELSSGEVVTADIIRPRQRIGTPAVLGSVFRRAAAMGLIQPAGVTTAQALSTHGRLVRVWRRT